MKSFLARSLFVITLLCAPMIVRADGFKIDGYRTTSKQYIETTLDQIRETAKRNYSKGMSSDDIDEKAYRLIEMAVEKLYCQNVKEDVADRIGKDLRTSYEKQRFETGVPDLDVSRMTDVVESMGYDVNIVDTEDLPEYWREMSDEPLEEGEHLDAICSKDGKMYIGSTKNGKPRSSAEVMARMGHEYKHKNLPSDGTSIVEAAVENMAAELFGDDGPFRNKRAYKICKEGEKVFSTRALADGEQREISLAAN